jgi:iron complex outermembrane receptor protein
MMSAGATLSGPVLADDEATLSGVVVSASKIEQTTLEAPANVSVVTSKDLEKDNNQRVGDALNAKVPGLYLRGGALGNSRPNATMSSSMRGQGGTLTKLGVFVDGLNMVDAYSGQINWSMVAMDDIERVEVVPGVGSSLYGSNAVGGVISIITKAPTKREVSAKAGYGFEDSAGKYVSALYRDKLENGLGIVFGLSQADRDGYSAEYVTKTPSGTPAGSATVVNGTIPTTTTSGTPTYIVGDKGSNATRSQDVHAKLYYDLSATARFHAGFAYNDSKSLNTPYHVYLNNAATGQPLSVGTSATDLSIDGKRASIKESDFYTSLPMGNTALRYFAGFDGRVFADSKISIAIGRIERDTWSSSAGATATAHSGTGTLNSSPNTTTNASIQLGTAINDSNFLVAGLSTEIGRLNQRKYSLANWTDKGSQTGVLDQIDARSITNSIFLQDQLAATDKLTMYLGARYDDWKAGGTGVVITGSYPGSFDYPDRGQTAFSPKIAGVYMLNDSWSLKSSLGTGFRAPTNYYMFANPTFSGNAAPNGKMIYSNPNLKPEKATAFDLGTEHHFASGGRTTATYFITKTTDLIYQKVTKVPTYTDPVINKVIDYEARQDNTGSALARGIELAGEYPLLGWLSVRGSYAYTDSRITDDTTNTGMKGKRVTNVPKQMATLALDARHGDWTGVLSARYVGEQYNSNDNSDVVKGVWTGYSKYTVVDLKAGYQLTRDLRLNVMVDNVFDKEYYEYYRMPGRGFMVEIAGRF